MENDNGGSAGLGENNAITIDQMAPSDTLDAASALMPYFDGDTAAARKGTYLTYRFTGFSVREAVAMTGINNVTVARWRDPDHHLYDEDFVALEKGCIGSTRAITRPLCESFALTATRIPML